MADPILSIQQLCVDFTSPSGNHRALDGLNLTVRRGEIVAVVGESGSGKSVTALSILRLLKGKQVNYPSGKILFYNDETPVDLLTISEKAMQDLRGQKIAMIFQEPMTALNPVITCGEQVAEAIRRHLDILRKKISQKK